MIKEAKLFKNGQSQAVRLPKEFRFDGSAVCISKVGSSVMLTPLNSIWENMIDACSEFSEDFMACRNQPELEERNWEE